MLKTGYNCAIISCMEHISTELHLHNLIGRESTFSLGVSCNNNNMKTNKTLTISVGWPLDYLDFLPVTDCCNFIKIFPFIKSHFRLSFNYFISYNSCSKDDSLIEYKRINVQMQSCDLRIMLNRCYNKIKTIKSAIGIET